MGTINYRKKRQDVLRKYLLRKRGATDCCTWNLTPVFIEIQEGNSLQSKGDLRLVLGR